jgi:transposase-like protein
MKRARRQFDLKFKQALVQRYLSGEASSSQLCREFGLSNSVIHRWIEQAKAGVLRSTPQAPTLRERDLERENLQLKEKLADLYMQVEALKKVESWKVRQPSDDLSVITSSSWAQSRKAAE